MLLLAENTVHNFFVCFEFQHVTRMNNIKMIASFITDGQQHSSGTPKVPVISSGCDGGSDVTTAELELCRLNVRTTLPFHVLCSFCFGERLDSEQTTVATLQSQCSADITNPSKT